MARLFLTWIGFTVLHLGAPSGPSVAAFRPGGESTHAVPQAELRTSASLALSDARSLDLRVEQSAPPLPSRPGRLTLAPSCGALTPQTPGPSGPLSSGLFLPEARAPPA